MANPPMGAILMGPSNVMQKGSCLEGLHVCAFKGAQALAQSMNPEGMLPIMTAGRLVKVLLGNPPYSGQQGICLFRSCVFRR